MKTIRNRKRLNLFVLFVSFVLSSCIASAQPANTPKPIPPKRTIVFVSDTHMGLGRNKTNSDWSPYEDFRWNGALKGFLRDLSSRYSDQVDLVVLGDFLELWQPFPNMKCTTPTPDAGCTEAETLALALYVIQAHQKDFADLDQFLARGDNKLYIVPGNHDAALLIDPVWSAMLGAFPNSAPRIKRMTDGVWLSASRRTVAEHGHQIGKDANRYDQWPAVTTKVGSATHIIRPWGEQFVQSLFNDVEAEYPTIDNLSPESLGARYRLADKGLAKTAKDLARFVIFNLFETSRSQKVSVLSSDPTKEPEWDLNYARTLGHKLVLNSLPPDDEFAGLITESSEIGASIRKELDSEMSAATDVEVRQLCDHAAIMDKSICQKAELNATVQSLFNSKTAVMAKHLQGRRIKYPAMTQFVYGHTHEYEVPWSVSLQTGQKVTVANTGAFQRVIDADGFNRRRKDKKLSASQTLKGIALDDLPPCYTFVVIEDEDKPMQLFRWHQSETTAVGTRVEENAAVCK
ncbi:MAG: metallophosphoesterase [Arenimonas sp.]